MIGRADIEGSKSNVAMNAWLPQASYPCGNFSDTSSFKFRRSKGSIGHAFTMCRPSQTPHLTMSSARIDPPKRVLGLKEGVVTPPPIHGSFHKVGLESSSTGSSFPADSAKPVPLAVVSLDSRQGHRIPLVRTSSELAVRRPGKAPERAVPSPSPGRHEAVRSRHVSSSSSPPTVDGFGTGTPEPSPQSQSFSRSYGSILPTSLAYIVPSTRGCSPWRPDAVMSTTERERHSVLRIFKGRRECTGHHATCGALPAAGPYLRLSRFQGGQAICTDGRSARARALGFAATAAPSYSSRPGSCPDGRVSAQLGTVTRLPVHPASPVLLTKNGPLGALDSVGWLNKAATPSYLFNYRCGPPPEFPLASPRSGIVHHLSGPDRHAHTRTLLRRSRSVGCAPVRDPANQLPCALRVYSPVDSHTCQTPWSVFQDGSNGEPTGRRPEHADAEARRSGHDGALTLSGAPFQGTWARSVAEDASPDYNSNAEDVRFSSWALPGLWVIKSFWTGTSDYMTRIKFTTACQDAPDVFGSDFGQPRAVTHGRSASVPYPREDGGTTICDTQADVPSARRLGAQLAFKDSMVHGILQFTPSIAFRYVLHRCESRDIRCRESYAYNPTKTEVLAKDERITTESAGTVRNRPTESDVSSFSGRSVSRMANHPRRRDPNTSPDHSIGRSDGRGVLKATSADPWSASFMVETRTLFVFHKSKNFTSDYEIRMPPTACFEHSNFFKVTAPEARPGQLRPGAYRRQKRQADRCSPKADRATHPKDVSARPSAHTGRPAVHQYTYQQSPWTVRVILAHVGCLFNTHRTSVSTRRTSVAVRVCPCVRQCTQDVRQHTQDVRQHTQDVRQHTQDVRGCPCVSVCASVHTGRPSAHTGRPSAHAGRPCVRQCTQDVRQHTQDVRQHTQDVRQHTQDVRGCPCVSVCPSVHTGRPSAHTGRPSAHAGRPSAHAGRPWLSVCVRVSVSAHRTSVSTHRTSVSTRRTSVAVRVCPRVRQHTQDVRQYTQDVRQHTQDVRQHTQDVRGRPSVHISACWPFLWTVRVLIHVLIRVLNSYQHADHTYQHAGPSRGLSVY
ncbi:hypothetical protein YC2023_072323 [Brassica napus]